MARTKNRMNMEGKKRSKRCVEGYGTAFEHARPMTYEEVYEEINRESESHDLSK